MRDYSNYHNSVSNAHGLRPYVESKMQLHNHGCNVWEYLKRHVTDEQADSNADAAYHVGVCLATMPIERIAAICRLIDNLDNGSQAELITAYLAPGYLMLHARVKRLSGEFTEHVFSYDDKHDSAYFSFRRTKAYALHFKHKRVF